VLGKYVREEGWLTLEDAVRKMTGQVAYRYGLAHAERGLLKAGWFADLVVFDPATVIDRATFQDPYLDPEGIRWVLVNGVPMVRDGELTPLDQRVQAPPGRFLLHTSDMPSTPQPGYDFRAQAAPQGTPPRATPGPEAVLAVLVLAGLALRRR
jgi:MYXO-CTERM domain-containing protein